MRNVGFLLTGLLLIFVGLKLAGVGDVAMWSWWAVMSPFWVPLAAGLSLMLLAVAVAAVAALRKR